MTSTDPVDPAERFTHVADDYARFRPDYPAEAIDALVTRAKLGPRSLIVDVGCGTGISSRLFAQRGLRVIGIEPNAAMRERAAANGAGASAPAGTPAPVFRDGRAESTGLPDQHADLVLAAQAFHWFEADDALREFWRVLRPGGRAALLWNERDETDACTAAYGTVVKSTPEAARVEGARASAGQALLVHPWFIGAEKHEYRHGQELDQQGLVGRALSVSYAPSEPAALAAYRDAARGVFARFQRDGKVVLRYVTSVFVAQRRG